MMAVGLDLGNLLVHLRADASQYFRTMDRVEQRMRRTADTLTRVGRRMTMMVTLPLAIIGGTAVKAFASFDDAMVKSLAIMGDVSSGMQAHMREVALTLSKEGVTSAKDLAKSYFFLASAGLTAQQSVAALATVERFAVAGAFDMALATDLLTDAQSALGLTVADAQRNMENMTRVSDVLTGANTLANATTEQFSKALTSQAGPAMKSYKVGLEEGVAVLAAYADQGIKAERAGNMFGRMLRLMTKGFKDNEAAWRKFGINIFDANEELKPMHQIVKDLSAVLGVMSTKQKIATLAMLGFQARSQQAILPLLGLGDRIEEYTKKLEDMAGITKEIADKQLKSFSSQMKILKNNIVAAGIEIGRILAPTILKINEQIKQLTRWWSSLTDTTKKWVLIIVAAVAAIGPLLMSLGLLLKVLLFIKAAIVTISVIMFSWLGLVLLVAAAAYTLRAVWLQNFMQIRDTMERWFNAFKEGFDWLRGSVVGKFVIWFGKSFISMFEFVKTNFKTFVTGIAGVFIGTLAWLHKMKEGMMAAWTAVSFDEMVAEIKRASEKASIAFFKGFEGGSKVATKAMDEFTAGILEKYDSAALALKKFGTHVVEGLADLWVVLKKQFGEDLDTIIALFKKMVPEMAAVIDESMRLSKVAKDLLDPISPVKGKRPWREWLGAYTQDWIDANALVKDSVTNTYGVISQVISDSLESISDTLTDFVMTGKANFNDLANSILRDLTQMIIKAQMAQALMSVFGLVAAAPVAAQPVYQVPAPAGHSGGIVGSMRASRYVPSSTFAGASRYHNGLASDEVPTILQVGEVVLSKDNVAQLKKDSERTPRGGGTVNINVNAIDAQGTYQFLSQNKRTIASMLQNTLTDNHPIRKNLR